MAAFYCYAFLPPGTTKENATIPVRSCYIPVPSPNANYSVVKCYRDPHSNDPAPFNRSDPMLLQLVISTLKDASYAQKWLQCAEAADECCAKIIASSSKRGDARNDGKRCPPQWDAWYCWPDGAAPGTVIPGSCPDYIYTSKPPDCQHYHHKECFENGTWREHTDYSTCSVSPGISTRVIYHVAVLGISLISAIPALVIFFSYRKLRVLRVALHRSLIMAIAARNLFTILSSTFIILAELHADAGHGVMEENGVPCRVLAFMERLSANAVFALMLLEGLYLHRLIAGALRSDTCPTPAIVVAVALTFAPAIAWAAVMATLQDSNCWSVDTDGSGYQWINDAPRIAMIAINTVLLVDIARVMLTKLRTSKSANAGKLRMTAKATLFLMPLFGVQLLFTVARPNTRDCVAEQVYYFFAYTTDGLQGFFVVLIYCFLNKEVRELLARSWRVWSDKTGIRDNMTSAGVTSRRATLLTTLPVPNGSSAARNSLAPAKSEGSDPSATTARSLADRRESHV
ncbi:corticotropin-releasing factor receptor 1-like isoform X2 [Ischnura elegans]|nr:corticotropin-releasing factor receptor 1-like isoform X2 [Ischnura elegans]